MFRTVRGFLALAPALFAVALLTYLATRPHAAETFVVYPFLAPLEPGLPRGPLARFSVVAILAFLGPYLVGGLLLLLADLGISAAAALWRGRRPKSSRAAVRRRLLAPESLGALLVVALASTVAAGLLLKRVAGGGELPGGVNVAPAFVAAVPFAALAAGFAAAFVASIPRALLGLRRRRDPVSPEPIISR